MASLSPDVSAALASLQTRWGAAAPRVIGALATAPLPAEPPDDPSELAPSPAGEPRTGVERIVRTGFPALDAIVGPGGLPRSASVALRGAPSSGATTLALRLVAEAQADGAIVAWLDLARALDPVEAAARGVRLDWLVVLTPETLDEGLSIAGMLLAGRSVDVLVIDLPPRPNAGTTPAKVADRLRRLAGLARRAETLLVALEPPGLTAGLATAVAESTGLRLELSPARRGSGSGATSSASGPRRSSPGAATGRRGDGRSSGSSTPRAASGTAVSAARTSSATRSVAAAPPCRPHRPPSTDPDRCDSSTSTGPTSRSGWRARATPTRSRPTGRSSSAASRGRTGR